MALSKLVSETQKYDGISRPTVSQILARVRWNHV